MRGFGLVAGAIVALPAWAQPEDLYPPLVWVARENRANATDEAVDVAFWTPWPLQVACGSTEPLSRLFVTGFVTETTGATRFATYHYDPNPPGPDAPLPIAPSPAFYPFGVPSTAETHKAVAMAVDCAGNLYVTGMSQRPGGTDMDIVTISYDKHMVYRWDRRHDFGNFNQVPTDITVDTSQHAIVVVGTTFNGANDDIVSIAYGFPRRHRPAHPHRRRLRVLPDPLRPPGPLRRLQRRRPAHRRRLRLLPDEVRDRLPVIRDATVRERGAGPRWGARPRAGTAPAATGMSSPARTRFNPPLDPSPIRPFASARGESGLRAFCPAAAPRVVHSPRSRRE